MNTTTKKYVRKKELLLQKKYPNMIEMRQYVIDTAWSLDDYRLIKMLYIRAKTLKNAQE